MSALLVCRDLRPQSHRLLAIIVEPLRGSGDEGLDSALAPGLLFVVRPHSEHVHDARSPVDRVDQAMLDVDPAGGEAVQVPDELLERGWRSERVLLKKMQQPLSLRLEA